MPDDTKTPAGKKGAGKGLKKKIGPFSAWVWLVIAAAAGGAWWYFRRSSDSGGGGSPVDLVTGSSSGNAVTPQDMASAGQPSTATAPGSQMDDTALQGFLDRFDTATREYVSARDAFTEGAAAYEAGATNGVVDGGEPASSSDATVQTTLGPPGGRPARKTLAQRQGWVGTGPQRGAPHGLYVKNGVLTPKAAPKKKQPAKKGAAPPRRTEPPRKPKAPPRKVEPPKPKKTVAKRKAPARISPARRPR